MTNTADLKMAVLAALIALTTLICARGEDRVAEVEPTLMQAPLIEKRVLAG
jgi:hypothetical protein